MTPTLWARLDTTARSLAPFAFTLLLVMFGMIPFKVPDLAMAMPALGLIAVYFWLATQPHLMPAWAVFVIGLMQDLLGGGALGVSAFVLLVVFAVLAGQRRFFARRGFLFLWLLFVPVAAGAFSLTWLFNCLIADAVLDPGPATLQYVTTVAFYPCVAWIFLQARRAFLK